jgi:propane monooxygenase reductase component
VYSFVLNGLWKIMSEAVLHKVRLEPVGIEMDVEEGETVLNAAFRQGIALMHGCKEGQCASCKSKLISGDIELLKYSTFALPDYERETVPSQFVLELV